MEDIKMDMLCDKNLWADVIERKVNKKKNKTLLSYLCNPVGRASLIQAIADNRYEIQPPRTSYIDKNTLQYITYEQSLVTEKVRELFACSNDLDNIVLTLINEIYMKLYKDMIHPACLSYQKGIGVKKIIYENVLPRLQKGQTGYKVDISKYFDNVNIETIEELLNSVNTNSPLDKILWDMYHDNRVYIYKDKETTERYMSLRQGCPVATFLADICLNDIDTMASSYDVLYVRYSDDLLIIGDKADEILDNIKLMLLPKGLELNPKKVEKISSDKPFTFLGMEINGNEVDMSKESLDRIKREIRHIVNPLRRMKGKGEERRKLQEKAIKKINWKLREAYLQNNSNWGWEAYFFSSINVNKRIQILDFFIKDHIKAIYSGNYVHTRYSRLTSNEQLKEMGYKSLSMMYNAYKMGPEVYKTLVRVS